MTNAPIPASTLILYRENVGEPSHSSGAAQHLFVERAESMAFAAGALVFPGGRVDDDDHLIAEDYLHYGRDEAAARVAAIRETLEEAGVAVGLSLALATEQITQMRAALAGGALFSNLLAAAGLSLDLEALVPFARWCPNHRLSRVFDTRFYIARAPEDAALASVDATENVRLIWATAQAALQTAAAGDVRIIFPTQRNLERLATVPDFNAAVAHALAHPVQTVVPFFVERDGERYLTIPQGLGYPVTEQNIKDAQRA